LTFTNRVSLDKNNNSKGRQLPVVLRIHVSVAQQQKTANVKVAFLSRPVQWSLLAEKKQKSQLAQTEFRFIKTIIM
jgi:hypothetical protein